MPITLHLNRPRPRSHCLAPPCSLLLELMRSGGRRQVTPPNRGSSTNHRRDAGLAPSPSAETAGQACPDDRDRGGMAAHQLVLNRFDVRPNVFRLERSPIE